MRTEEYKGEDEEDLKDSDLLKTFAQRLKSALDANPELGLNGRARVYGFSNMFGVHYATANRILNGKTFPSFRTLVEISRVLGVSESWLLGRNSSDSSDTEHALKITKFALDGKFNGCEMVVASESLDKGLREGALISNKVEGDNGFLEDVIVRLAPTPSNGMVHLFFDPQKKETYLRRITIIESRREIISFTLKLGTTETLSFDDLVFGQTDEATKLSIVGPVIARVVYHFKGDAS